MEQGIFLFNRRITDAALNAIRYAAWYGTAARYSFMMKPTTIDRIVQWHSTPMLVGVTCWFGGLAFSGVMLVAAGAMGGSFSKWRNEPGLWMLGALCLTCWGSLLVLLVFYSGMDAIAGRVLVGLFAVDAIVGTLVLAFMVRFSWAVTCWNWRISHGRLAR